MEDGALCGEQRSETPFSYRYRLTEEDHHFAGSFFRISKVYRLIIDRQTGEQVRKELVLDNQSLVVYDPALIPPEQIWG